MKIKIHKKADDSKQIYSIDVFRNEKWAYTITANEFMQILYELSKNRLDIPTESTLIDTIKANYGGKKRMEDFVKRMIVEKEELKERIDKLNKFMNTEVYERLSDYESELLNNQLATMEEYLKLLSCRIGLYIKSEYIK